MPIEELPQVPAHLRAGLWIAWYRGRAISAHADRKVLAALMAAEGLADEVRLTHDDEVAGAIPAPAAD